jgi:galactose-1-phosphate uridylyltransferase
MIVQSTGLLLKTSDDSLFGSFGVLRLIRAMEIKFERYHLQSDFRSPLKGFESVSVPTEIRIDPLTKRRIRIITLDLPSKKKFDFSQLTEKSKGCFFCPENVFTKTPQFLEEIIPEGRLQIGEAIGFPNLNPIGTYSNVIVLCSHHFLDLNQFTPQAYKDGFSVAIEIIKRTMDFDPNVRYWCVNQNYLFPAGSTILHPHLQVIGDPIATNEMESLLNNASSYYQRNQTSYWNDLIHIEKGLGKRYIANLGRVHWIAPFAPIGSNEVCGIVEGHESVTTLNEEEISSLAQGIISILKYYDSKNLNSFNFSIYSLSNEPSFQLFIRTVSRSPLQSYYPNDWTSFKLLQSEPTLNTVPEELCREIQPFFS